MRLSATNLCWSAGGAEILRDVSLDVEEGEFFGIIGPNGSGKTTLMSLLSGIRRPQGGSVNLQGTRLTEIQRRDVAKCIAFVEQHAETSEKITARQTVELGRTPYLGPMSPWSQHDDEIVDVALHHVDMSHLADRLWHTLSGGERQRLHIARALAQQPRVLLLDEPTNHLDIGHQLELLELVGQLNLTVIAALHDLNHAATFCDRIALMQAGHLVAVGRPSDVLTADRIRDVFGVEAEVSHIGDSCHIRFLPRRFVERPQERAFRAVS